MVLANLKKNVAYANIVKVCTSLCFLQTETPKNIVISLFQGKTLRQIDILGNRLMYIYVDIYIETQIGRQKDRQIDIEGEEREKENSERLNIL